MIKPANKTVVLALDKVKTKGLVVIEKDKPETGRVISFGKGKKPVAFKKGDILYYRKFGEFKFWHENKEVVFVKFEDILGVLNES